MRLLIPAYLACLWASAHVPQSLTFAAFGVFLGFLALARAAYHVHRQAAP